MGDAVLVASLVVDGARVSRDRPDTCTTSHRGSTGHSDEFFLREFCGHEAGKNPLLPFFHIGSSRVRLRPFHTGLSRCPSVIVITPSRKCDNTSRCMTLAVSVKAVVALGDHAAAAS